MRSIETQQHFPLASVKPLDGLLGYRQYCLARTHKALHGQTRRREQSPVSGERLERFGEVDGLSYVRCPASGSLFLAELPTAGAWARLLQEVNQYRHAPGAFYAGLGRSRTDHVYSPKLEWIQDTLRLQGARTPRLLEVTTPPSDFTQLLRESGAFSEVLTSNEMELTGRSSPGDPADLVQAAVMLECFDRVDDPPALLRGVVNQLAGDGLLFVTALVSSGFDMAVLGLHNLYLYPPDRANCFSRLGLEQLLENAGLVLLEVSTPGVLDVEIVRAHLERAPSLPVSTFERQLAHADERTQKAFQGFLQQHGGSSFARIVARKTG